MRRRGNPLACDQPEVHDVYRRWRRIADSYHPPRRLIGEVNLPPARAAHYVGPDELHQAFAFAFLVAPWDAEAWRTAGEELLRHPPVTWVVENHDVVRTPTRYGNAARARAALLTILGLPGSAYLYQGQELGLPEADVPPEEIQDPAYARTGISRDGCRQPTPWSSLGSFAATLRLAREAIRLRRDLPRDGEVAWAVDLDHRLTARRGDFSLVVAMGTAPVPLPSGDVLLTSDPLDGGLLRPDSAAWVVGRRY
jgi:alpha-glucosidase